MYIPLHHTVITGVTGLSGKSTTIDALLNRMDRPSIVFRTKRGEIDFTNSTKIPLYFKQRTDWEYVASLMEAALREKLKFERGFIIQVSRGASSLADVHKNIKQRLEKDKREFLKKIWTELDAYMEKILPELQRLHFSDKIKLNKGVNIMDLIGIDESVQMLIIQSSLQHIYEHMSNVIVGIPEMWKTCPQAYKTPVKLVAEHLVREGRSVGIYVFADAQDVVGVEKRILKSVDVWILGRQREINEIKRTLAQIPSMPKPSANDIAQLKLGEFYACFQDKVIKVYVQPAWCGNDEARAVAMGHLLDLPAPPAKQTHSEDEPITRSRLNPEPIKKIVQEEIERLMSEMKASVNPNTSVDTVQLTQQVSELVVVKKRNIVEVDDSTSRGTCYLLIAEGYFDEARTVPTVEKELRRRGKGTSPKRIYEYLDEACTQGFLWKTTNPVAYVIVQDAKLRIRIKEEVTP